MYLGMHKFARLLELKARPWSSFWFAAGFALVLALLSTLIPHIEYPIDELTVDTIFGIYIAACGLAIAAALLAWRIRSKLAPSYQPAMSWLIVGLVVLAFSSLHETLLRLLPVFNTEEFAWYSLYGVSLWPLLVVAIFFLGAGLSFRKLSQDFLYIKP